MNFFKTILPNLPEYRRLDKHIDNNYLPIGVTGVSAVHKAHLITSLCMNKNKKAFVIASNEPEAYKFVNDFTAMGCRAFLYPVRDYTFRDIEGQSSEYTHNRLEVLANITYGLFDVIVFCIDAAMQLTIPKDMLEVNTLELHAQDDITIEDLCIDLLHLGYERTSKVEGIGQFSIRGDIIDFFTPNSPQPTRIELWGNTIDTISQFELDTQRRIQTIDYIRVIPTTEILIDDKYALAEKIEALAKNLKGKHAVTATNILHMQAQQLRDGLIPSSQDKFLTLVYNTQETILDYMDKDIMLFLSEPAKVRDRVSSTTWRWHEDLKGLLESGDLCRGLDDFWKDSIYLENHLRNHGVIYLDMFVHQGYSIPIRDSVNFTAIQLSSWSGSFALLCDDLKSTDIAKMKCAVLAGTDKAARSLAEDLVNADIPTQYSDNINELQSGIVTVLPGTLSAGFEYPLIYTKVITHGQITQKRHSTPHKQKHTKNIYNLSELTVGDCVVHTSHGIGIFNGVKKITMNGIVKDYITISYDKGDILYVPVTQLDLVSKYVGSYENTSIKLNKLGTNDWKKTKSRVRANVKDIADHLIKLYTERMKTKGYCFSKDNEWQKDFERHFEYDETDDQLRCIQEIKHDMESDVPMDRLLCGDVGFGKTEVALRAAFKCVCDSKQCAMLVPTTILAWQHYQTVSRRFEGFPVRIELLSRFRTQKQQNEILKKLSKGDIDMVIGTHRLVQNDVKFRDLGLVIIDEEQRFGVKQKEHFKNSFKNVDVLTLSATPIPRTLNMAMSGIRDMSTLDEAPRDRQPIQTYVLEHNPIILTDAILKELRRGGQVYYLHNRVETISQVAGRLKKEIPDAKIGIAHGKMDESKLAEIWEQVISQEINVLVCTTIIETGVDIPNVNTLIIEDADHMGLAQLHQIRGRVGRSTRRAYAYLTFHRNKVLSDIAQRRLAAIKEFTEFGSGVKIAMRDLELRGAGNILGGQQHGYMADVGYEMYIKLLNNAVSEAKGEKVEESVDNECLIDIQISAYIPDSYISSTSDRIEMYRHISDIQTDSDVSDVTDELIDRFGEIPSSVLNLIDIALIRSLARSHHIYEIKQNNNSLFLYQQKIDLQFVSELTTKNMYKVLVNASSKPYISIEYKNDNVIDVLKSIL